MRPLPAKVRLSLITLPYVIQLCVAVASLFCYYCSFTLMLRDWASGAEIGEVKRLTEKILGHGWMVMNSVQVICSGVLCVVNLYSVWKKGYIMALPFNTISHVSMYILGPTDHSYAQAVRNSYKAVPSWSFTFSDLATFLAISIAISNFGFSAVYLYRSSASGWWKKVDRAVDEAILEDNEAMKRAAQPAYKELPQDGKEPIQLLEKTPEAHRIITGSMCLNCKRGSFTERKLDGSVGEHDKLVGIEHGAQTLEFTVT